ncbi:hypothetical protein [Halomonas urumqiensis]|uniref:Uncharacterized protein n=1 Tax=Halomonas urumqiensis TaxID=1684789 RepID=A0A2N7UDW4_9GAMM|nr:hypothetical protein [Halomonas urumqiensis]PMR78575.1 hypothetical protein C1H70_17725 [Halomonas urumqiensis]PTB03719.1 hypothetical protein C6V82_04355 [Halomonas urumqiensis]GHE20060.1 hypothetical protein GCM10017767_05810 [Halomonas urumqiensis]
MNPDPVWSMLNYALHLIGLLICLGGLTLARKPRHRLLGRMLAGGGFLVAASPTLYALVVGT